MEESRRDSLKLDKNEILNRDDKLKEEVVKLFLDNFPTLALHPNHYGKTDILELEDRVRTWSSAKEIQSKTVKPG